MNLARGLKTSRLGTACRLPEVRAENLALLVENPCGRGLVARADLQADIAVAKFTGPIVPSYAELPPDEIRYALGLDSGEWLIPRSDARYLNHSCDANCRIDDSLEVITVRPVSAGEELTISYNLADPDDYRDNRETYFWDPLWNFTCLCGTAQCEGTITGYRFPDGSRPGSGFAQL